jgi:TetR/AcrR family transcriptional regulator, mexCD-oprJ operon repressor
MRSAQATPLPRSSQAKRESALRSISAALARAPTASFRELATNAGMSRATLYRIARSREELMVILTGHSAQLAAEALVTAEVATREPIAALHDFTTIVMQDSQAYVHLVVGSPEFSPMLVAPSTPRDYWSFYNNSMVALFRRGQREKCFRTDCPAHWLRWTYDALLLAAVIADLNGGLAARDRVRFVMQTFLDGTSIRPRMTQLSARKRISRLATQTMFR